MNLSTPTPNKHSSVVVWGSTLLLLFVGFLFFGIGFNADFILADESLFSLAKQQSVVFNEICWPVKAANAANGLKMGNIIINEVAWMGTEESYNDEWIELYNNSDSAVNLDDWILKADDGSPEIELSGRILSKSFYLLERTDNQTVAAVLADQIYKGGLTNKGECLKLFDEQGNLIDKVDCSDGWFTGDNKTKQTMERSVEVKLQQPDWQTSQEPGGTPKRENSKVSAVHIGYEQHKPADGEVEPPQEVQPPNVYPSGIVVNEVLPSPEGPDAENEWIEIFNENNFEVALSGWKISDTVGSVKSYTFPKGIKISGKGFLLLNRPETKITLNNSNEGLKIFNPNGEIVDEINFGKAVLGQSYNRFDSEWQWSENLTPGSINITSLVKKEKVETRSLPNLAESGSLPTYTASLSEVFQGKTKCNQNKFSSLVIALIIAICSGIIILFLKKKLKTN